VKISIITAVRNRAETIAEAIASVAVQTHPEVEHLIIDGASTDGTLEVAEGLRTPAMRIVSEADHGIYDALNKGLSLASGEIIGVVHSDDVLAGPHVLEWVAAAFADPQVAAVYGDLDYVADRDSGRVVRHWQAGECTPGRLRRGWMPPHPTLFIRRHVFERHGGYDTTYRIAADYDAILRWLGREDLRTAYIPRVMVRMRLGGASNASLGRILRKSREDYRALRANRMGGLWALAAKNLGKLPQFLARAKPMG
jgi:glycosyltransferase involved in cell wall biosynthesis